MNELENFNLNVDDFINQDFGIDLSFGTRYIRPPKAKENKNLKYANAEKLAAEIKQLSTYRYFCIVNGSFIFGDFIEAFIVKNNLKVKRLTISTLSLSQNNVDSLANLLNGGFVDELNLLVSGYFYSHEKWNLLPYIYKKLDVDNKFQLAAADSHCKMVLIETESGHKIVMHGSANLRSSDNIEQFSIEEDAGVYDFNMEYQTQILEKYKTIDKTVRGKEINNILNCEL